MANETEEYLSVSSFKVSIDGMNWETFETVSGIGVDLEDISFQSDKKMMLNRPGRYNARDITLIRRFKKDRELYDWIKKIKDGKNERKSGSVILFDDEDTEVVRFNFFG
ncbi:MAG: phage tail protein, partial [Bdellovibrionales bacterium]|nr:phage tail protein [Bdellovibrionales bacterium]